MKYKSEEYYEKIGNSKVICVDFDNTICLDEWPYIGPVIPGAFDVLLSLQGAGHKLILFTQRNEKYPVCWESLKDMFFDKNASNNKFICNKLVNHYIDESSINVLKLSQDNTNIDILSPAISLCQKNHITFYGVNSNTDFDNIINDGSRKVYMDYIIDDHSLGTPTINIKNSAGEVCKVVNWFYVDRICVDEGLYNECAIKCSLDDYIKAIKEVSNEHN